MKFTSLFLENLFLDVAAFLSPLNSCIPTTISGLGSGTISSGTNTIDNSGNILVDTVGTVVSSIGSGVTVNAENSYEKTLEQLNTTQAYVESLTQEELESLISKLEIKTEELTLEDINESFQKKKANI